MGAGRQLFVYWRCDQAEREAALAAVRTLQTRLRGQLPDLQARLYLRCDGESPASATLMEVYALPGGVGADAERRIETEAAIALQPWQRGARHVEAFEAADVPAPPPASP